MGRSRKRIVDKVRLHLLFWRLQLAVFCLVVGAGAVRGEDGPASDRSLQQVLEAITAHHSLITSYYVEYRIDYLESDGMQPGAYLHRTVAMKAPASILHINAHGHTGLSSEDDPFRWTFQLHDKDWASFRNNSETFSAGKMEYDDPNMGSIPGEWFFWATGLYPLTSRKPFRMKGDIPYMLLDYASEVGTQKLRDRLESVSERWCHVIERPGVDVLWLDLERGATLMRRDMIDEKSGNVRRRYLLEEHQEVQPGFWMPKLVRDFRFGMENADEQVDFKLMNWRINDVPDSVFVFSPPSGAVRVDHPAGNSYQVDGSATSHMKNVIRISKKVIESRGSSSGESSLSRSSNPWKLPGIAVLCGLVCVVLLRFSSSLWRRDENTSED